MSLAKGLAGRAAHSPGAVPFAPWGARPPSVLTRTPRGRGWLLPNDFGADVNTRSTIRQRLPQGRGAAESLHLAGDDVFDRPRPGRPPGHPVRRLQRPTREDRTVGRPVRQLDPLALPHQQGLVLADDVAAAHHGETDRAGLARARTTFARIHRELIEGGTPTDSRRMAKRQRRAGR